MVIKLGKILLPRKILLQLLVLSILSKKSGKDLLCLLNSQYKSNTAHFLYIYCNKGAVGDKEAGTNTLIMKDKILWLKYVLISKVKRKLKSKTYIYMV